MNRILVSVCALAVCGFAAAQQRQTLSFEEALQLTMTDNPSVQAARYEEEAARRERQAAVGLHFPTVSVGGAYTYMGSDVALDLDLNHLKPAVESNFQQFVQSLLPTSPDVAQAVAGLLGPLTGQSWDLSYTLQKRSLGFVGGSVSLPIFLGGKIDIANRMARLNERSVREQTAQTRNALVSELVERYFGYTLALQVVNVRQQVLDGMRRHLADAEELERNGMIAASERLYVEFKAAEAERELLNAEMQVETIRSALGNTVGTSADVLPVTAIFVVEQIEPLAWFQEQAADRNPLLNQLGYKQELARQNVHLLRAEYFPQIVAMGGGSFYNYQVSKLMPRWAVGIGINFKLFNGLNREYKHAAARQTALRVETLREKADQDIAVLIESLYARMLNYRNQVASIEASMAFATEYLKSKETAFREGMSSSTDLIDAQLNLAKVRVERMQAAYNYDVALAKLLEAAGMSDDFTTYLLRGTVRSIRYDQ